jgi:cell division protein FtsN
MKGGDSMKTRMGILVVLIFSFLLASCSKEPKIEDITEEEVEEVTYEEIEEEPVMTEEPVMEEVTPPPTTGTEMYGYRVQVGAFKNMSGAEMQAAKARSAFPQFEVYNMYIEDWNKVWIGDFLTRSEAESVRDQAIARGFPGSFLVETTINR